MRRSISRFLFGLFAAPLLLVPASAWAGDACGKFDFSNGLSCGIEVSGGCQADCTPVNFVAACDAQCTGSAEVSCTGGCETDCEAKCTVDPGTFECQASCEADCGTRCDTGCAANATSGSGCAEECKGSCTSHCSLSCKATPPSADCTVRCQASCDASCTVESNIMCSAGCTADITGGCDVQCQAPEGAIFCNGQYVDATDITGCITELATQGITVDVTGQVSCGVNGCTSGLGLSTCAVGPAVGASDGPLGVAGMAAGLLGLGLFAARRRRRS